MNPFTHYTTPKLVLITLVSAVFIVYPNISCLPWEIEALEGIELRNHLLYFTFRYIYISVLIFTLIKINLNKFATQSFNRRFVYNLIISAVAYGLFVALTLLFYSKAKHFGSILLFQFFVVTFLSTFMGHIYLMASVQRKKEQEIEQLKIENLQSRYDALMNQINPHFFFNSMNGLTSLIRKKNDQNTLNYVNKMSDVFRYILQSDKKGVVSLEEELEFVNAFLYMMEVRFANKLQFNVDIDNETAMQHKLPVLSILPLIENVVVHNRIDSEHKMVVSIYLNQQKELVVSNPIYPKLTPAESNGTGLHNLNNRFSLLLNKQIRIVDDGETFCAYLPLA